MNKIIAIVLILMSVSCSTSKKTSENYMANEPFVIYKTRADYSQLVPIILGADKQTVVAYPAPADLKNGDQLRLPTQLIDGYLLDNRGITLNVAFTSYTYNEYAALNTAPSLKDLMESIVDKEPLVELYDCSQLLKHKNDIEKVNQIVKRNFKNCVRVK